MSVFRREFFFLCIRVLGFGIVVGNGKRLIRDCGWEILPLAPSSVATVLELFLIGRFPFFTCAKGLLRVESAIERAYENINDHLRVLLDARHDAMFSIRNVCF